MPGSNTAQQFTLKIGKRMKLHSSFTCFQWYKGTDCKPLDYTVTSEQPVMTVKQGVTLVMPHIARCIPSPHVDYTLISLSHAFKPADAQWTLAVVTEAQWSPSTLHRLWWIIDVNSIFVCMRWVRRRAQLCLVKRCILSLDIWDFYTTCGL